MKRPIFALVAAAALLVGMIAGGQDAQANTSLVLDFEGLGNLEKILDFYDGGFGGYGSGPGPDYGISFGPDALALIDADAGGSGNFANEPSADTIAFFLTGPGVVMNVKNGFTTGFSFFYTSARVGTVTVFDGPNGTGNVLATVPVEKQHNTCGAADPTGAFSCWTPVGVTFSGTAFSVNFGGVRNQTGFDDITLGSATPGADDADGDGDGIPDDEDTCPDTPGLVELQGCPAVFLAIDEDSVDSGNLPNFFSDVDVNDPIAEIGLRYQLPFFAANVGNTITLRAGEVGDEGWFALKSIPDSWAGAGPTADGLRNYLVAGPGLGTPDINGEREALLDKVADVTPLRATGLKLMEGRGVCAVAYDSDISINYDPLNGSVKGANLGTLAFEVVSVTQLTGFSSSLPEVTVEILDASEICDGPLALFTEAPEPISSSEPFDVVP